MNMYVWWAYAYIHVTEINEKQGINLKKEGYRGGLGGRKGKGKMM